MTMRTDEEGRRLIREDLDRTLVVEAAAGTGKTTELVNRILQVLAHGRADIREIVAVTFTEKAAGELKLRLRQGIELERRAASDPVTRGRLDEAAQHLEQAHVSTIHGFCADLLRERPVEARIDPLFRVLTEAEAERLFAEAFGRWLERSLANPGEGLRRSLRRSSRGFRPGSPDEDGPMERLRRAAYELAQWRDLPAPWTREPFDRAAAAAHVVSLVHQVADLSRAPSYAQDNLFLDTAPVRRLSATLRAAAATDRADDLDAIESLLVDLRRSREFRRGRKGSGAGYGPGVRRSSVLEARETLTAALDEFQERADADLAALLQEELIECVHEYEALKQRTGALDFLDLLLKARDLLRDNALVRQHFQGRFRRIFVDEFQDTDPLQAEILLLLAADRPLETRWRHVVPVPGKLFIVGDPRQSIYRFRRADVGIYREVCDLLLARGAVRVELRRSFRAVPNIQRAINAAFGPIMADRGAHGGYMPLEPAREDYAPQPSVVVLPVPAPYGTRFLAPREIERSLPDAVGAYIDWLVHRSNWMVTERRRGDARVPIEARHICVLFRRFVSYGEDITRPYVAALEARGVRHLLVGGRAFHDREEIEALRAALMAIEWPDDQLSVFATLRGPFFAISDDDLLEYHHYSGGGRRDGRFHPFRIPPDLPSGLAHVAEALGLLAALHKQRNRRPVADTISTLLEQTRAHVGLVLRPGGEQALANVLHVAELARQYELEGGMSFRGFVALLQDEAAAGQGAEAPILEEGADGVRLMTVHKAKGLEFPVVILADMTARLTPWEITRFIDAERGLCALRIGGWLPKDLIDRRQDELQREREEAERIAYVAATRARDLLVVPAIGDAPYTEGWVSPLNDAIYPSTPSCREQRPAPGCPPFSSRDSVLQRPDGDPASPSTVCPGLHVFGGDSGAAPYSVVWWSPADLSLGVQAPFGLRRDDLIVKDVAPHVLMQHKQAYEDWRARRQQWIDEASQPSLLVRTATEAAAMASTLAEIENVAVAIETAAPTGMRPAGRRFGALVHAVLADVPLGDAGSTEHEGEGRRERGANGGAVQQLAEAHGRILGATTDEVTAAIALVSATLAHPVMRGAAQAAEAARCYRETPVTLRLEDGTILEGHVDLAFEEDGAVVVVDFKTDRELDGELDRYRRQVQIYAAAIAEATGKPARGVLMRI